MEGFKTTLIPNSTQIPNVILDVLLPHLPETVARCLLYICRRTFGFQRQADAIGLGQFQHGLRNRATGKVLDHGTGLGYTTIFRALKVLEAAGLITVKRHARKSGHAPNTYQINLDLDPTAVLAVIEHHRQELNAQLRQGAHQQRLFVIPRATTKRGGTTSRDSTSTATIDSTGTTSSGTYKTKGNQEKPSTGSGDNLTETGTFEPIEDLSQKIKERWGAKPAKPASPANSGTSRREEKLAELRRLRDRLAAAKGLPFTPATRTHVAEEAASAERSTRR